MENCNFFYLDGVPKLKYIIAVLCSATFILLSLFTMSLSNITVFPSRYLVFLKNYRKKHSIIASVFLTCITCITLCHTVYHNMSWIFYLLQQTKLLFQQTMKAWLLNFQLFDQVWQCHSTMKQYLWKSCVSMIKK